MTVRAINEETMRSYITVIGLQPGMQIHVHVVSLN